MNYGEQRQFLRSYRQVYLRGAVLLLLAGALYLTLAQVPRASRVLFVLVLAALLYALNYLPKYLHLTTHAAKRYAWLVRVRWFIAAAVGVAGASLLRERSELLTLAAAVAWLLLVNLFGRRMVRREHRGSRLLPSLYYHADLVLLLVAFLAELHWLMPSLLALAAHLALVVDDRQSLRFPLTVGITGSALTLAACSGAPRPLAACIYGVVFFLTAVLFTFWLVRLAWARNVVNVAGAVRELREFTGLSDEEAARLLVDGPAVLAESWKQSRPAEDDPEALAAWYRDNSFYYLFDLTAFHLTYKHIAFSLDVLRLARGRCLDYGAGTGRLALELARRGHPVTYFDVEGKTRDFAEWRARREGLAVGFTSTKNELRSRGLFDTVVSLDVLEHLPDLRGELDFLVSLLGPGGRLILTIPSGPTHSHPMHLPHDLDVAGYLRSCGLHDAKTPWLRWTASETMRKPTVLVFDKPGELGEMVAAIDTPARA